MVRSMSRVKVIHKGHGLVESALHLLLLTKQKKSDDDAIARFCCNVARLRNRKEKKKKKKKICLVQVRLRTETPRTPSSAQSGLELMTSRS